MFEKHKASFWDLLKNPYFIPATAGEEHLILYWMLSYKFSMLLLPICSIGSQAIRPFVLNKIALIFFVYHVIPSSEFHAYVPL